LISRLASSCPESSSKHINLILLSWDYKGLPGFDPDEDPQQSKIIVGDSLCQVLKVRRLFAVNINNGERSPGVPAEDARPGNIEECGGSSFIFLLSDASFSLFAKESII
jgi:hypothetical protein